MTQARRPRVALRHAQAIDERGPDMTVAELIVKLQAMPQNAVAVDEDELEVLTVTASRDMAVVYIWTERK